MHFDSLRDFICTVAMAAYASHMLVQLHGQLLVLHIISMQKWAG